MTRAPWLDQNPPERQEQASRKPRKADPVSRETRALVRGRSGGVCEIEACGASATHVHHRQSRRFGRHSPTNLLHVCAPCHRRIHGHVDISTRAGWIVSAYDEPALREVAVRDEVVWLGEGGELLHMPPPQEVCS